MLIQMAEMGKLRVAGCSLKITFPLKTAKFRRKKAPHCCAGLFYLFNAWQFPTLAWGDPTLPSALRRFTSEFGMGSGGTTALQPPGKSWCTKRIFCAAPALPALAASVTYFSMLLPLRHWPPCISTESFVSANFIRHRLKIMSLKNASGVVRLSLTGH